MSVIRIVQDMPSGGAIAARMAALTEVWDKDSGEWYLYYTVGSDLSDHLTRYTQSGWTLSDPEITGLYSVGLPIHRRKIVKPHLGPNHDQALADADGENDFPRLAVNEPVCYVRPADGQVWLVYARGPHMRQAIDELWKAGKALHRLELMCTDEEGAPIFYQGVRIYRRLIVAKDKGMNPTAFERAM